MTKPKSVRVWVAVDDNGMEWPWTCAPTRRFTKMALDDNWGDWERVGITIRRATLTLDPVKPKKRRKP